LIADITYDLTVSLLICTRGVVRCLMPNLAVSRPVFATRLKLWIKLL